MKKYVYVISVALFMIGVATAFFVFRQNPQVPSSAANSDYNPNYADAIQKKKPELCQNINYALQSGPTDGIYKVYGKQAVEECRSQANAGFLGCECDSEATLNKMR